MVGRNPIQEYIVKPDRDANGKLRSAVDKTIQGLIEAYVQDLVEYRLIHVIDTVWMAARDEN